MLVGVFLMLQPLSTDLYLASLPGLSTRFAVDPSVVQLTLSLFVFGFGLMQLVSGPMSDRWGRRPVLLGGLALYVAASLACAAAPTIGLLVAARFLQAIGCCTVVVVARAIVRDAFEPAEGARVLARASSVLAIGPMLGPIAGSLLEVAFGFRAAFLLLAALARRPRGGVVPHAAGNARASRPARARAARARRRLRGGAAFARVPSPTRWSARRRTPALRVPVRLVVRADPRARRADRVVRRRASRSSSAASSPARSSAGACCRDSASRARSAAAPGWPRSRASPRSPSRWPERTIRRR